MKPAAYIRYDIVPYTRGNVLELGNDGFRSFPHFITVDEGPGRGWRPDVISNLNDLSVFASASMDAVLASDIINKYDEKSKPLKEWWRVLKNGGYLILHFPEKDTIKEVIDEMGCGWDLCLSEVIEDWYLVVFKKGGSKQTYSYTNEKPKKTCAICRYGGFGDMIQMSPILPVLKDQGYHITVFCSPYAMDIVKHDPHINEFIVQDRDQIPNQELVFFWSYLSKKYDKFINLSESVEGSLLAMADRAPFKWPKAALDAYMGHNYHEFTHLIAGVPMKYAPKFYPTPKEVRWAEKQKRRFGTAVMWVLAGSSVHKVYPWMDQVIARFMLETDVNFVFVGGEDCKFLEEPWKNEKRVHRLSGECSIRETMALAKMCDVVIGPETGVLNSVSHEDTPKVVLLSHSSTENLTKHWENCISMEPENCQCYPCHRMIYGFDDCTRDEETGVALCQARISPDRVVNAIKDCLNGNF